MDTARFDKAVSRPDVSCAATTRAAINPIRTFLTVVATSALAACSIAIQQPGPAVNLPSATSTTKVVVTGNASYTGLKVMVDGNDVTSQMVSKSSSRDEGDLSLSPDMHTLVASADVPCWYCSGNQKTRSTATQVFTVAVGGGPSSAISLILQPASLTIERGAADGTTVWVTRAGGFTGDVDVKVTSLPAGIRANPLTIPSGLDRGTLVLTVDPVLDFSQHNLTVTGAGPGGLLSSAGQTLALLIPRTSGAFREADPAPYFNSVVGSTVNSLSGAFSASITTGPEATFRWGTQQVGSPISFQASYQLGGAGFCVDNDHNGAALTRGVVMKSARPYHHFEFVDLMRNSAVTQTIDAADGFLISEWPRVFFSPDCTLALVSAWDPSASRFVVVLDLLSDLPPSGPCGWPLRFNSPDAFSARVKVQGTLTQVEVTLDAGTPASRVCTYTVP
jgi:hypothetical protein